MVRQLLNGGTLDVKNRGQDDQGPNETNLLMTAPSTLVIDAFRTGPLSLPSGPLMTIFSFLHFRDSAPLRLVSSSFRETYDLSFRSKEWSFEELFDLNMMVSRTFQKNIVVRYVRLLENCGINPENVSVVIVKYEDAISTNSQIRCFPIVVPRGFRVSIPNAYHEQECEHCGLPVLGHHAEDEHGLTLRWIELLFVMVYGNWPFRSDGTGGRLRGSPSIWASQGKGAELLQFGFLKEDSEEGEETDYDPSLSLFRCVRAIPKDSVVLGIQARSKGIVPWRFSPFSLSYGWTSLVFITKHSPEMGSCRIVSPRAHEKPVSRPELCELIHSESKNEGRVFPQYYEIFQKLEQLQSVRVCDICWDAQENPSLEAALLRELEEPFRSEIVRILRKKIPCQLGAANWEDIAKDEGMTGNYCRIHRVGSFPNPWFGYPVETYGFFRSYTNTPCR